jgi:quercetin dioxygenase-like cupin family protein
MKHLSATPSSRGPAEWFTGEVWIDFIAQGEEPSRALVCSVHFTPGAHTAWHSHTLGQTLYITEGVGLVQSRGEPVVTVRAGDIIDTAPDEWHWHGATPDRFMTHLAIADRTGDGQGPETKWGDHVGDQEYPGNW